MKLWPFNNNVKVNMTEVRDLNKSVEPKNINKDLENHLDQSKVVFGLDSQQYKVDNIINKRGGRLLDKDLRDIAHYDSIVSLIINTRCNQAHAFGNRSRGKYDRGYLIREIDPVLNDPSVTPEEKEEEQQYREGYAHAITRWIDNCGVTNRQTLNFVFNESDTTFKYCTFSDFLAAQTRNLLTFGRAATQIIRSKDGIPIMFRPLPVETLYRVIDGREVRMTEQDEDTNTRAAKDSQKYNRFKEELKPAAYVQRINGKTVSFFTDDELSITYLQKQAFEGLSGYPLAPVELAYYTILMHYHAQIYQQNQFTKGLGSKGVINIKTQEGGVVSKTDIDNFRKMFSNYVARNDNSATIPVMSGPIDLQFIELSATAKDLEFNNMYARLTQIMCASFQISPQEIGFGSLDPNGAAQDRDKQDSIVQGEERGLRILIEKLYETVLSIADQVFPDARKLFTIEPVGLGQNTKESDLKLYTEELQTSGTFQKIWGDSDRTEVFPFGGNVPTSPIFHSSVAKYIKYSELRYYFFNDKEALNKPEYDFICDPSLNEAYQGAKNQTAEIEAESQKMGLQQQQMEMEAGQQQMEAQQQMPPQPEEEPENDDTEKSIDESEQKREWEKHQQKIRHNEEKHKQSLKLAYEKAKAERKPQNTLEHIIAGARRR